MVLWSTTPSSHSGQIEKSPLLGVSFSNPLLDRIVEIIKIHGDFPSLLDVFSPLDPNFQILRPNSCCWLLYTIFSWKKKWEGVSIWGTLEIYETPMYNTSGVGFGSDFLSWNLGSQHLSAPTAGDVQPAPRPGFNYSNRKGKPQSGRSDYLEPIVILMGIVLGAMCDIAMFKADVTWCLSFANYGTFRSAIG